MGVRSFCIFSILFDKTEIKDEDPTLIIYIGDESKPGVYKAIDFPIFAAAIGGLGKTYIFWNNLEFVCDIEQFIEYNDSSIIKEQWHEWTSDDFIDTEYADFLCPNCKIKK